MATHNLTLKLSNGQSISVYIPENPAEGTFLKVETNGKATENSQPQFYVADSAVEVTDIWTTCPTGVFTILSQGQPTNIFIDCAVHQVTANMRPRPLFAFQKGNQYLLKVVGDFPVA